MPTSPLQRWCAGLALVLAGTLASPSVVPVYDGVGAPDEPYKYVGGSPAPAGASITVPAGSGLQLKTSESGPQLLVDVGEGAVVTTAPQITLRATPLRGDGRLTRGAFDGNAYRISLAAPGRLNPANAQGFLYLRAAEMTSPDPVIAHRELPGGPWVEQKTSRVGRDILATPFRSLGDYAVVRLPGAKPIASLTPSTSHWLQVAGVVLAALVLGALVIRSRRPQES